MTLVDLLVAIAGHGLEPTTRHITDQPLDDHNWPIVLGELEDALLGPLALEAARAGGLGGLRGTRR